MQKLQQLGRKSQFRGIRIASQESRTVCYGI